MVRCYCILGLTATANNQDCDASAAPHAGMLPCFLLLHTSLNLHLPLNVLIIRDINPLVSGVH